MVRDRKRTITAKVYRSNPLISDEVRYDTYQIECLHPMTVLEILRYIFRNLDPTLAFRDYECYQGVCMSCQMLIGGKKARACSLLVEPGEELVIQPLHDHPLIKDLVVSFD